MGVSIYALSAQAEAGRRPMGWYVAVEGGGNWIDDGDVQFQAGPVLITNWEAEFDSGWAVFAEVGYRWENNWRLELEGGWRENDVDCISFGGPCVPGAWGDVSQFTQMINIMHDIDISPRTSLAIGIGFGGNFVDVDTPFALRDDDDFVIAGQGLIQLTHELDERLDFILTYRYMTSDDPEFKLFGPGLPSVEFENENQSLTIGLRFDLQADAQPLVEGPVGPPPPPPPPMEPRQFIVFFGFNKTALTRDAMEVIRQAAETAMREGTAAILVTGHTDTVGSQRYNQQLSERRAHVVKRALANNGIRPGAIIATSRGETMLMVQTGDGAIEPRNRRVTIDLDADGPVARVTKPRAERVAIAAPRVDAPPVKEVATARVEAPVRTAALAPRSDAPVETDAVSTNLSALDSLKESAAPPKPHAAQLAYVTPEIDPQVEAAARSRPRAERVAVATPRVDAPAETPVLSKPRVERVALTTPSAYVPAETGAASPGLETPLIRIPGPESVAPADHAEPRLVNQASVDDKTLARYRGWISEARAKHPYEESEAKMYAVMMCESGGKASTVNAAGPYAGLFQYRGDTWRGGWNQYRDEDMLDAKTQIFATALAWQRNMQSHWGCYSQTH